MEDNQDPKVYTAPILENLPDCTISAHSNVGSVRTENQDYIDLSPLKIIDCWWSVMAWVDTVVAMRPAGWRWMPSLNLFPLNE